MLLQSSFFKIIALVTLFLILTGAGYYIYTQKESITKPSSQIFVERYPYSTIEDSWLTYKDDFIQQDGRTVDKSLNFLTTSEGQSYSMLRSVWVDDKAVFDAVLEWTKNNLQKREDSLFMWKWGERSDGTWGILEDGGENSASDADLDIALALILANKRWNQEHYLTEAKRILNDIWDKEVVIINDRPYLVAGNWAKTEENPTINPSYFNFAGYDIFAEIDPVHDWMGVKDTSYEILNASTKRLPPDWLHINGQSGEIMLDVQLDGKSGDFKDDAVRIPWRVGLDWKWNRDPRALAYLEKLNFLKEEWDTRRSIFRAYTTEGQALSNEESLSTYGSVLPYFEILHPDIAEEIYLEKLGSQYDVDIFDFKGDIGYYSKNWAWFGMAFYEDKVINTYRMWKEEIL